MSEQVSVREGEKGVIYAGKDSERLARHGKQELASAFTIQ